MQHMPWLQNLRHDFIFFAWFPSATGDGIQYVFTPLVMEMVRGIHIYMHIHMTQSLAWCWNCLLFVVEKPLPYFFSGFWNSRACKWSKIYQSEMLHRVLIMRFRRPALRHSWKDGCDQSLLFFCNFSSVLTSAFTLSHSAAPWAMCRKNKTLVPMILSD